LERGQGGGGGGFGVSFDSEKKLTHTGLGERGLKGFGGSGNRVPVLKKKKKEDKKGFRRTCWKGGGIPLEFACQTKGRG